VCRSASLGVLIVLGLLMPAPAAAGSPGSQGAPAAVEAAVLAVHDEMTRAGEAGDADRLFSYMMDTDTGSVIQNGVILATRAEALEQVRSNLRGVSKVQYTWRRRLVTVLSPEIAVLAVEGDSTMTLATGGSFSTPLAQTIVFVSKNGQWKAIQACHSLPRAR
jgi:uncharacterized protein (TIGR02246 family)